MESIVIDSRFCGPPKSANGGYTCGLLASHIEGDVEITLLAPPPLGEPLDLAADGGGPELTKDAKLLARGRSIRFECPEVPTLSLAAVQDAMRRSSCDEGRHPLPACIVCGPARAYGDGLRVIPRPLPPRPDDRPGTLVALRYPGLISPATIRLWRANSPGPRWIALPALPRSVHATWGSPAPRRSSSHVSRLDVRVAYV